MRTSRWAVAVLATSLSSCDAVWTLHLAVEVTPEAQAASSPPQELRVRWGYRGAGFWYVERVGVLCGAAAEPFSARVTISGVSGRCPGAIDLEAWLEPLDPGAAPTCGPRDAAERLGVCWSTDYPCSPLPGAPRGDGAAFATGCRREAQVTLAVVPASTGAQGPR